MSDKLEKAGYKHVVSKANPFVRYADDFIVMIKTKEELPVTLTFVKEVIEEEMGLKLSGDKTKLTNFKRGFLFKERDSMLFVQPTKCPYYNKIAFFGHEYFRNNVVHVF